MKEQILQLRAENKTYDEIQAIVGCSKGTISYHCGEGQKQKTLDRLRRSRNSQHPYMGKINSFKNKPRRPKTPRNPSTSNVYRKIYQRINTFINTGDVMNKTNFTLQDIIDKFGENPQCYLTGQTINIYDIKSYEFDHIIPRSRGGDNSLENLGICIKAANQAKRNMTPDEFINLCKQIVEFSSQK